MVGIPRSLEVTAATVLIRPVGLAVSRRPTVETPVAWAAWPGPVMTVAVVVVVAVVRSSRQAARAAAAVVALVDRLAARVALAVRRY